MKNFIIRQKIVITFRLSGCGHTQTNQIFISDHIEQFIFDLGTAMTLAKANTLNYSKIEEIINSCQAYHRSR